MPAAPDEAAPDSSQPLPPDDAAPPRCRSPRTQPGGPASQTPETTGGCRNRSRDRSRRARTPNPKRKSSRNTSRKASPVAVDEDRPIKMDWYILKVQSNREDSIREGLQRRVKMAGLDKYFGEIIVPTEMVTEFKGGKKRVVKRKLYPGYLVVHMEINDDTWFLVRETPGIGDFTGSAGKPTPMLPHEVAKIVAKQEEKTDEAPQAEDQLQEGRSREDQRRHVRELRRRSRQHRRGQRPRDGDDQHFRPLDAGRIGILADRSDVDVKHTSG